MAYSLSDTVRSISDVYQNTPLQTSILNPELLTLRTDAISFLVTVRALDVLLKLLLKQCSDVCFFWFVFLS